MNITELERQKEDLNNKIREYYRKESRHKIEENKNFSGMTLKKEFSDGSVEYYKILRPNPENEYRFDTITFALPLKIDYESIFSLDEDLIRIEDIGFLCAIGENRKEIDCYEKISSEEFNISLDKWISELKENIK